MQFKCQKVAVLVATNQIKRFNIRLNWAKIYYHAENVATTTRFKFIHPIDRNMESPMKQNLRHFSPATEFINANKNPLRIRPQKLEKY